MRDKIMKKFQLFALSLIVLGSLMGGLSFAADVSVDFVAESYNAAMPDGINVEMWGFGLTTGTATVPGPTISATEGDNLTINLTNNLAGPLAEPVSLVIPGQAPSGGMTPVFFTDGDGDQRVRSFTHETAVGAGPVAYTWNNLKAGTYLIQSGTHPAVQVQMGLYAVLIVDAADGAYNADTAYDAEQVIVFSEIDPVLHEAIETGIYGTGDPLPSTGEPITSAIEYHPKYFLINGQASYDLGDSFIDAAAGSTVLLRFVNAGLKTRSPVLQGSFMNVIAEDGNLYNTAKEQYSVHLQAGKTKDAIISSMPSTAVAVYDRRAYVSAGDSQLAVVSPNGGESLVIGSQVAIDWQAQAGATNYIVKVSTNNGATWATIATGVTTTSLNWTVAGAETATALVRVTARDASNWLAADDSDAPFSIVKGGQVVSPNGGESYGGNSQQMISWTANPLATTYNIRLSLDNGATWSTVSTGETGTSYNWMVPDVDSTTAIIRVISRDGGNWLGADESDAVFSIVKAGTVLSPNGSELLDEGSQHLIEWTANPLATSYNIRLSLDGGSTWTTVTTGETGTSYNWTVPNTPSANVLIRVISRDTGWLGADESDAAFSIVTP